MWTTYRTVILDSAAQEAADQFCQDLNRFEQAFEGLEWFLARRPQQGMSRTVGGHTYHLYVQSGDELAGTPDIWVLFEFDADHVWIRRIAAQSAASDGDG